MTTADKAYAAIVLIALAVALVVVGYLAWPRPVPVVEAAKPAIVQADQSVIIERTDTQPSVKPRQAIPKKAKVERVVSITVTPHKIQGDGLKSTNSLLISGKSSRDCPPVTLDMTLVREQDGSRRVIASSPDGAITKGLDIPVDTAFAKPRDWAVGVSYNPIRNTYGGWASKDFGRIRTMVSANQTVLRGERGADMWVHVGVTF